MEAFLSHFSKEWRVIKGAPVAFLLSVAVISGLIWVVMELRFGDRIADYEAALANLGSQPTPEVGAEASGAYSLAADQWSRFVKVADDPNVSYTLPVIYQTACEVCLVFAHEVISRLRVLPGWQIDKDSPHTSMDTGAPTDRGIHLLVANPLTPPDDAALLTRALTAAGLAPKYRKQEGFTAGQDYLLYIAKPDDE